jgi:hypothetical protein
MKILKLILFLILTNTVFGQKGYKYKYDLHLKNIPSTYSIVYDSITNRDNSTKFIFIESRADTILQVYIKIKSANIDTVIHNEISQLKTITKMPLKPDKYDIIVSSIEFSTLNIDKVNIYNNTATTIISKLGYKNELEFGEILSKRKLNDKEIEKIIDDYSNRRDESELIKNKTCIIMWQI